MSLVHSLFIVHSYAVHNTSITLIMSHCPVGLVLPLHYYAIIKKVAAKRILVNNILQCSEEIPALNDTIVLHLLLDGGHFGLHPP